MTAEDMTCESFDNLLQGYLEHDIDAEARSSAELHVLACSRCAKLVDGIMGVRAHAAELPTLVPDRDLWEGVATGIATPVVRLERPASTRSRPIPRTLLVAAGLLLVAGTSVVTYQATVRGNSVARYPVTSEPVIGEATSESGGTGRKSLASGDPGESAQVNLYQNEIARLQRAVRERRSELDPQTIAVLESNLRVIDEAIRRSHAALARDPASGFLSDQMTQTMGRKVELLRTAVLLPPSA